MALVASGPRVILDELLGEAYAPGSEPEKPYTGAKRAGKEALSLNRTNGLSAPKADAAKMVIRKMEGWSIVLFVDRDDSESKAQSLAEEILNAFKEERERDPSKDLPKQIKYEFLTKIPEIAILLDQQPITEDEY